MLEFINFYLIPGLVLGTIYALGAIGVSLLFGILRFAHFAHGDLMTFGAYAALAAVSLSGWPAPATLPLAMVAAILLALVIDRTCYRPLRTRPPIYTVIAAFGVALMVRSAVVLIWGNETVSYQSGIQRPLQVPGGLLVQTRYLWIAGLAAVAVVALHLFLTRTWWGRAMRAVADNPDLARVSGIATETVVRLTWIIGAALAALAGVALGADVRLNPYMGWDLLLAVFAAALVGGIGRPYGAIAGGLIVGLAEELATYPWIGDGPLVDPGYKSAVAFCLLLVVLILRPRGLLKGSQF